ncbi:M4 family metallopeptidase [Kitasatospora sp. NPDC001159]
MAGRLPDSVRPASSPTPDFPASLAATGAAEAQRNAAAVYDFFHDRLGRNGIDGVGGPANAVVNVTSWGESLANAYWGSGRMTYGGGNAKFYPFAVALDVTGHEMTHGVVENTAKLVMRDQSGALDEALADYFGNAVEATTLGISMTDPRAALLGESLCRTGTQEACAERRLDTGRTTVNDYVGLPVHFTEDASHDNSAIMSGALWDIRRTLDPLLADRLVYRALAEYLTPLDTFVDARDAVLAAGRSLGLTRAQLLLGLREQGRRPVRRGRRGRHRRDAGGPHAADREAAALAGDAARREPRQIDELTASRRPSPSPTPSSGRRAGASPTATCRSSGSSRSRAAPRSGSPATGAASTCRWPTAAPGCSGRTPRPAAPIWSCASARPSPADRGALSPGPTPSVPTPERPDPRRPEPRRPEQRAPGPRCSPVSRPAASPLRPGGAFVLRAGARAARRVKF